MVRIARRTIQKQKESRIPGWMNSEKRGIFVTLHEFPEKNLRGCIGITVERPVIENLRTAAFESAYHDPRFPPLSEREFDKVVIEVSILTSPKKCGFQDLKRGDGVIVKNGLNSGLLLPQVWDTLSIKEQFLNVLCLKAGLSPGCWSDKKTSFFKFGVEAFQEEKPNGKVIRTE